MSTVYTVQSFKRGRKGGLIAGDPQSVGDDRHALRLASRCMARSDGVIAFSQTGDLETGEVSQIKVLLRHGEVPLMDFDVPY